MTGPDAASIAVVILSIIIASMPAATARAASLEFRGDMAYLSGYLTLEGDLVLIM
jgi:hypothetical protein